MKIAELKRGDSAVVVRIEGEGSTKKRLLDLGLTKGCRLTLTRIAPLGDPVEIELRGYRISVRKSEAAIVELDDVVRYVPSAETETVRTADGPENGTSEEGAEK